MKQKVYAFNSNRKNFLLMHDFRDKISLLIDQGERIVSVTVVQMKEDYAEILVITDR